MIRFGARRVVFRVAPRLFDLSDRLLEFAATTCQIATRLPSNSLGNRVTDQLIRSCTAPAASHSEAQSAESRRDFVHKMKIGLKELRESIMWLRLAARTGLAPESELGPLVAECNELIAIFVSSIATAQRNMGSGPNVDRRPRRR